MTNLNINVILSLGGQILIMIVVDTVDGIVQVVEEDDGSIKIFRVREDDSKRSDFVAEGDMVRVAEGSISCIAEADLVWRARLAT